MMCQENLKASIVKLTHIVNIPPTAMSLKEASRGLIFGMVYHYVKMSNPFYEYLFLVRQTMVGAHVVKQAMVGRPFWSKRF